MGSVLLLNLDTAYYCGRTQRPHKDQVSVSKQEECVLFFRKKGNCGAIHYNSAHILLQEVQGIRVCLDLEGKKIWWEFLTASNFVILERGRGGQFSLKCSNTSRLQHSSLWQQRPASATDRQLLPLWESEKEKKRCYSPPQAPIKTVLTNHLPSSKRNLTTSPTRVIHQHWWINHLKTILLLSKMGNWLAAKDNNTASVTPLHTAVAACSFWIKTCFFLYDPDLRVRADGLICIF